MNVPSNGGSAFPTMDVYTNNNGEVTSSTDEGMSLRDYFAAKAMQAMVSLSEGYTHNVEGQIRPMVRDAYAWADEMLKARQS